MAYAVIEDYTRLFLNPIPHAVAAHFIRSRCPSEDDADDHCCGCCSSEHDIAIPPRHAAMIRFLETHPHDRDDALHGWLLRSVGLPGYWEGDFGPTDADAHAAFHTRFGTWRLPGEIHRCLTGRMDPASLSHCPRLDAMYAWLLEHARRLHPGCAVPRGVRYDQTVREFMTQYALLPHAVALQFCLSPGERTNVEGVLKYMEFGEGAPCPGLDPVRRWVMRSAGWDLAELPIPGVGAALLFGLQRSGYLLTWSRVPYAVALYIAIGPKERAMADWLAVALAERHPAILDDTHTRKMTKVDRVVWNWMMKSVGRRHRDQFRNRHVHRAFFTRFGSWRLPDDVLERLDHQSGTWGLSEVLVEMYEWALQHNVKAYQ